MKTIKKVVTHKIRSGVYEIYKSNRVYLQVNNKIIACRIDDKEFFNQEFYGITERKYSDALRSFFNVRNLKVLKDKISNKEILLAKFY